MLRRGVHLGLAELRQRAVDLGEQQEAAEGATLAQTAGALSLLDRDHPGGPLRFLERAPAGGDALEGVAHLHLCRGARVGGDGESAADLAELARYRHVQATFT